MDKSILMTHTQVQLGCSELHNMWYNLSEYPFSFTSENSDFSAEVDSLLLTIPPSPSSSVSLVVVILDDSVVEMREEHFSLSLSSSQTGVSVADNDTTTISITDDDSELWIQIQNNFEYM